MHIAEKDAAGTLYVGQRVTLNVELLAPGYFANAPAFDLPDPAGVILVPPQGSPYLSSETIKGTAYTVQHYEIAAFAARAGTQTIPPLTVRFAYNINPLDKNTISAEVKSTPVTFAATTPPGSENLNTLVVSARGLEIKETWRPEIPDETTSRPNVTVTNTGTNTPRVKVGDAFTRTITTTAPDIPGMVFTPFPSAKIDGMALYTKPAEILDRADRGNLSGGRRDTITYVCEQPGRFTIPAARITWFDLDTQQLTQVDFPAHTFDVAANPSLASGNAPAPATPAKTAAEVCAEILDFITTPKVYGTAIALIVAAFLAWKKRRKLFAVFVALRPVHLQPLNPTEKPHNKS